MTRKAIVLTAAAIGVLGLIAAMRHCLRMMARSRDPGALVELCGPHPHHGCDSSHSAATTAAAA